MNLQKKHTKQQTPQYGNSIGSYASAGATGKTEQVYCPALVDFESRLKTKQTQYFVQFSDLNQKGIHHVCNV